MRYGSDIARMPNSVLTPDFVSLKQALQCYTFGRNPRSDSDLDLLSWPSLDLSIGPAEIEFLMACQDGRFLVGGRYCRIRVPHEFVQGSPEETRKHLRSLPHDALSMSDFGGTIRLQREHFQLDGALWEHSLLMQLEWPGITFEDLPKSYARPSSGWRDQRGPTAELTAFCDVKVKVSELQELLYDGEPYRCEQAKQAYETIKGQKSSIEVKSSATPAPRRVRKSRAGRPAQYDVEKLFAWLKSQEFAEPFAKAASVVGVLEKEFGRNSIPHLDTFTKSMADKGEREAWMVKNVKTYQRR